MIPIKLSSFELDANVLFKRFARSRRGAKQSFEAVTTAAATLISVKSPLSNSRATLMGQLRPEFGYSWFSDRTDRVLTGYSDDTTLNCRTQKREYPIEVTPIYFSIRIVHLMSLPFIQSKIL
jgi:hypothetical protein